MCFDYVKGETGMWERKHEKLASSLAFFKRMLLSVSAAGIMILTALGIGILGYRWIAGLDWLDAILEASMILAGMGPVNPLATDGAKLFASAYALFSGLVFIAVLGIILTPVTHRMLHKFHIDEDDLER